MAVFSIISGWNFNLLVVKTLTMITMIMFIENAEHNADDTNDENGSEDNGLQAQLCCIFYMLICHCICIIEGDNRLWINNNRIYLTQPLFYSKFVIHLILCHTCCIACLWISFLANKLKLLLIFFISCSIESDGILYGISTLYVYKFIEFRYGVSNSL